MTVFWPSRRVMVSRGGDFFGAAVVHRLEAARERYNDPQRAHLGVGREIAIRELVALTVQLTKFAGGVRRDTSKPNGLPRRALDTMRARERFGFVARMPWEVRMRRTVEWHGLWSQQRLSAFRTED